MTENNQEYLARTFMAPLGHSYDLFIDDEITDPANYRDEFSILYGAGPSDVINVYINSGGGDLSTTCQFMNAIHACDAEVNTHLVYEAASGASMILLSGHNIYIHPHSYMMCHNASGGYGGKIPDLYSYAHHAKDSLADIMRTTYIGFLTEDEINLMLEGKEYWLKSGEIIARLDKRAELFAQQQEERDD